MSYRPDAPKLTSCPANSGHRCVMRCMVDEGCHFEARRREQAKLEAVCGARNRAGIPCRRYKLKGKTRCRLHGGLSTGPTSPEGKARSLAALERGRETLRVQAVGRQKLVSGVPKEGVSLVPKELAGNSESSSPEGHGDAPSSTTSS